MNDGKWEGGRRKEEGGRRKEEGRGGEEEEEEEEEKRRRRGRGGEEEEEEKRRRRGRGGEEEEEEKRKRRRRGGERKLFYNLIQLAPHSQVAGAVWNGVRQLLKLLSAAVDGERGAVLSEVGEAHAGKRAFLQRER